MADSILPKDIVAEAIGGTTNRTNAKTIVEDVLRNQNALDTLAVSEDRANNLTELPGLGNDLLEMSYGELVVKYGPEVANNRHRLRDSIQSVGDIRRGNRTIGQRLGDAALGAGASFVGLSGNTVGLAAGYGLGELVHSDGRLGAVATSKLTGDVVEGIRSHQSEQAQEEQRLSNIEAGLDTMDSADQMVEEIEGGRDPFAAALSRVGRDVLNTGDRILNSQAATEDILASAIGSLGPSAALARVTGKVAAGFASKATANVAAKKIATAGGVAIGVGASEAGGTYAETTNEVMSMSEKELKDSPVYTALIDEGYSPTDARIELAAITAETAFARQLPTAAALGLIAGRFEAAPLGVFKGSGVAHGLRTIASQGLEEAGQGGTAAYNQNVAIQQNVDADRDLTEGVGSQIAEGVIGGVGQAGISSVPATAVGTARIASKAISDAVSPREFNDPLTNEILGRPGIGQRIAETTREAIAPIVDRATGTDNSAQSEAVEAAQETVIAATEAVQTEETTPEFQEIVSEPDTTPVPENFQAVVAKGETFLGRIARVTEKLSEKRTKFSDSDHAFAGAQFARLRGMIPSMPESVKKKAMKILQSPQAKATETRLKKLDQNQTETPPITPDVVSETVSIAKTNPTNVNPDTVKKILEESGETISPEDTALLQSASRIASLVNDRQGREVAIAESKQIGLTQKSGEQAAPGKPLTREEVSRSVRVAGLTSTDGVPLRSINDFAAEIFQAAQSPDGQIVNSEGHAVSADSLMDHFGKLVTHLTNKTNALNESFSQNNRKGTGPTLKYDALSPNGKIIPAADYRGNGVFYHRNNPNSVATAKQVAADQAVAVQVYNELRTAFPNRFGSLPEAQSVTLQEDAGGYIDLEALSAEMDAQEASEVTEAQAEQNERRLRKDAVLKTEESLIDQNDPDTQPAPVLDEEAASAASEEQNQQIEDQPTDTLEDTEISNRDSDVTIDQTDDVIRDDDGNPIKFYHGTNADFTEFRDGRIFLTTRKGLARDHARRGEDGTPRLIETEVALANPLSEQIPNDEDPDTYWLNNALTIENAKAAGGYDSILLFNDKEGMIIADRNDQVTITNQDVDGTQKDSDKVFSDDDLNDVSAEETTTHESFNKAYQPAENNAPKNLDAYLEVVESSQTMNQNTVSFAKKLIRPMIRAMNTRLKRAKVDKTTNLVDALEAGEVQNFRKFRNTAIVDPTTGEYDQDMMEMAGVAFIDWLSSVQARDPNQLEETLEELGLTLTDISEEQMEAVLYGVSVPQAKAAIARDILRMWGVQENPDAPLSALVGIAEGIAAEMLTATAQAPNLSLLEITDLPLTLEDGKRVTTQTILVKGLADVQEQIKNVQGENTNMLAREELFDVPSETYSIGEKLPNIPTNQSRGNVKLSSLEQKAVGKMMSIPHFKDEQRGELFQAIGENALARMMGYVDSENIENVTYKRSIEGKNISIVKNIRDTFRMLKQLKDGETPVYYPKGVTKTGRHQSQGVNYQANKLLRAVVNSTHREMDLQNQEHQNLFWIGIAQGTGIAKTEKVDHVELLKTVRDTFNQKYRAATDMIKQFHKTGELDGEAFVDLVGEIEPQVLAAIETVANYELHMEAGAETMNLTYSYELDGLTNGAANMMVNFGQGEITKSDFNNFNRIGLFLGQIGKTVNQYFSARGPKGERNLDLYEKTSGQAQKEMFRGLKKKDIPVMMAASRFAARFGDFEIVDGQVKMTRNTSKNPMTKVNYGSSVGGVGSGLSSDMILEFYKKIQGIPSDVDLETYFQYPGIQEDIKILFGDTLPQDLGAGRFEFPNSALQVFQQNISNTLGEVLTNTTKNVIGDKIIEVNDMLVFSTNVQAEYVQLIFRQKLEEKAQQRAKEGKLRTNAEGKPILTDLSRRDYNSVVREMESLSPIFVSEDQTLAVGGFQSKVSDFQLSENMNGKLNQKSQLPMPQDVGVASLPYLVIGSGDAMVMNFVYGSNDLLESVDRTSDVFDGLDISPLDMKEIGPYVNQQVLKTWERDVLGMVTANYDGFLAKADEAVLEQAFQNVKDRNKKTTVTATTPTQLSSQLQERQRQNAARKAVLKRISVSVDQMGGSDTGFTRGDEEMTLIEINREIQKELQGKTPDAGDVTIEIQETTADAVLKGMRLTEQQQKVAKILRPLLGTARVIIGSVDDMNQYRQDNFPDDGQVLTASANYDAANDTIFIATTKTDTILHEMVHAATYNKVLAHYDGTAPNEAVTRLEALKDEFLGLTVDNVKVREAQAAILRQQAQNDPESQAAATNEFMAYALGNQEVSKVLQNSNTKTIVTIARKVVQLMRKLMGGIPTTMFDNVVFNTKVLNSTPVDDIAEDGGSGDNGGDGTTGEGEQGRNSFTNFWIETIKQYIVENFDDAQKLKRSFRPVVELDADADTIIDGFRQVGMLHNNEARATFRAIYMVMRSQIKMDPNSVIGLTNIFKHVEENLTPDMFGNDVEAPQIYSAVINSFDAPDSAAILLALSQTSKRFRDALEQVPDPQGKAQVDGSLNQVMQRFGQMFMAKIMGSTKLDDKTTQQVMNELADGIVAMDVRREYAALHAIAGTLDKADKAVSGKLSQLSNKVQQKNEQIKSESRNKFVKSLFNIVTLGTNLLDKQNSDLTADAAKRATHMNVPFLSLIPIRELVSELIGTDRVNKNLVALQDQVNFKISGMRQAYREDLPGILQNLFTRHPEVEEWASMHAVLGQSDLTKFLNPRKMQQGMQLLEEGARRKAKIQQLEQALDANLLPYIAQDAKDKAQQLANFMNKKGGGKLLVRNAYAIAKNLDGNFDESLVEIIDELVTVYVIDQMDPEVRETTVRLWQEDPRAVTGMVVYIQGLNEAEDAKVGISEQAKLNGYKGFIPNHGDKDTRIVIEPNDKTTEAKLAKRGFKKLHDYQGDTNSLVSRSYYVSTTRQGGAYSQGIMQNVQSTYRGVDINTGLTVTGETHGFISGDEVVANILRDLNDPSYQQVDDMETMLPVFDEDGEVLGFERAINPVTYLQHMKPDQNLAVQLGAWAGRHVEEGLAAEYNRVLLDEMDAIYQNREPGTDDLFINLKKTKDPIYRESFRLWPQSAKIYADDLFDGNGPMVRKDQINLSTGYREFSLADFWSGKTRMPKEVAATVKNVSTFVMGPKALKILSTGEKITQGAVSTAKDIIVIRSLVVPLANTISNVVQLATRGVPQKKTIQGYRTKLAEIEEFNKNTTELIELDAKLRLAANSQNQRRIIQAKMKVIEELNAKMSIAPIIEAGAYKQLSEGITNLDVDITKGRFGDIAENLANQLPGRLTDVVKFGLVSKSTTMYKFANRATQYGDFLAKSIYYDHLIEQGLSEDEAIEKMNEEFVNFSVLPGRVRSGLESFGLSWFMAFKLRIAKIAMQQLRDNPVRALAINNILPDVGSPVNDNIGQVIWEDRLDYATGFDMLFDAPGLNPWVNLLDG